MSHIGNKLMGLVCSLEFVLVPNGVFRYTDLFATYSSDSVQSLLSFIFLCGRGGGEHKCHGKRVRRQQQQLVLSYHVGSRD